MSIKIQINSLEALERLIGGDSDLEMEIRSSIVQEFTKRYLRDIAKTELVSTISKALNQEIKTEFFITVKDGWNRETCLKPEIIKKLKEELSYEANTQLKTVVSELIGEQKAYDKINEAVDKASNWILDKLSEDKLNHRLDLMVDKKLKEKLGLK